MEQVTVVGARYGVAEGEAQGPEGPKKLRVAVFIDPQSGRQYHFPLKEEQANELGDLLNGTKKPVDLVIPEGKPSPEELEAMRALGGGQPPGT